MTKKHFSILLRLVATVAVLGFVFSRVDIQQTIRLIRNVHVSVYMLACGISCVNIGVIAAARWRGLLDDRFTMPFSLMCLWSFVARSINNLLPGGFAGDLVRMWQGARYHSSRGVYYSSVITDRFVALAGMAMMSIWGVILQWNHLREAELLVYWILAVTGALCVVIILYSGILRLIVRQLRGVLGRFHPHVQEIADALSTYAGQPLRISGSLCISLVSVCAVITVFYLIGKSLGISVSWTTWLAFAPMITIISMIPLTVGGVGIRDFCMIIFLATVGVDKPQAVAVSMLYFSLMVIQFLLSTCIFWVHVHRRKTTT